MATSTRTRKPATTKAADAGAQAPAVPDFTTSTKKAAAEKRKPLFSIDGEQFTVPETIDQRHVFLGMDSIRQDGVLFSMMFIVELLLGSGQYQRLLELYKQKAVDPEQFDQITGLVSDIFFTHIKDTNAKAAEGKDQTDSAPESPTS